MAPTAPASATRATFSLKVISPRCINATFPVSGSGGRSPSRALPTSTSEPEASPSPERVMGKERTSLSSGPVLTVASLTSTVNGCTWTV